VPVVVFRGEVSLVKELLRYGRRRCGIGVGWATFELGARTVLAVVKLKIGSGSGKSMLDIESRGRVLTRGRDLNQLRISLDPLSCGTVTRISDFCISTPILIHAFQSH
jgi:hypothetical protein